ncbi:MAG: hypothetical protein ABUS79_18805, partial [Pseudomonadota bacterium]
MRRPAVILFSLALSFGLAVSHASIAAAKAKGGGKGAAPSAAELAKLKAIRLGDPKAGIFTWGMSPPEVLEKAKQTIEARFKDRIDGSKADPGKQQRIRDAQRKEIDELNKGYTKFEGQKTGWDVSIIGSEFAQNNGEAVIPLKEDTWTRYFFFFEEKLSKIFLAFNKEAIGDKSFRDFGKEMAAKYGAPREVYRDEKLRGSVKRTLDHFEWAPSGGDALKLVDRSEFYGVYCLVLSDASANERIIAKRKITNPGTVEKDALVEAVVNSKDNAADSNDDIIDRVTGHEVKKPGSEAKHGDIVVPMPTAPTPADVNAG